MAIDLAEVIEANAPNSASNALHYKGSNYILEVSSSQHAVEIDLQAYFAVAPEVIFSVLTNPDNTGVFRDIQKLGARIVLKDEPGEKVVEVEQLSEIGFAWFKRVFKTTLKVEENCQNPDYMFTKSTLVRADLLQEFDGSWEIMPCDFNGETGCIARLQQYVVPKGALQMLEKSLKGAMGNAAKRMVEDLQSIVDEVRAGSKIDAVLAKRKVKATRKSKTTQPDTCAAQCKDAAAGAMQPKVYDALAC